MAANLDALNTAHVTYHGTHVTAVFSSRDSTSTQFKQMVSFQLGMPVQFVFVSRDGVRTEWWTNGVIYNPNGPAIIEENKTGRTHEHHLPNGTIGREGGPAVMVHQYGVTYSEQWTQKGNTLHRIGGPAQVEIDYGEPHRDLWGNFVQNLDFEASVSPNMEGTIIKRREQHWYQRGKCTNEESWAHQVDHTVFEWFETVPPMSIMRTAYIASRELRWYDEKEQLHRVDGPAIIKMTNVVEIEKDGKLVTRCKAWKGDWYVRGGNIPTLDIIRWAKKNHILMHADPCHDKSAFRESDGELCFITDIAKEHMT